MQDRLAPIFGLRDFSISVLDSKRKLGNLSGAVNRVIFMKTTFQRHALAVLTLILVIGPLRDPFGRTGGKKILRATMKWRRSCSLGLDQPPVNADL